MIRKEWLVVVLLLFGIMVGFVVSTIVTFTLDEGRQHGSAFSLAHHYPETVGFFVLSMGFGIGFNINNVGIRKLIRVASIVVLLFYTFLAMLQITGMQLLVGVPLFVPLVIVLGLFTGYMIDKRLFRQ